MNVLQSPFAPDADLGGGESSSPPALERLILLCSRLFYSQALRPKTGTMGTSGNQGSAPTGTQEKVNLNGATEKELENLRGIGPASAKKIIAGRPYSSVEDLSRAGIPAKTIEKISPLVTVGAGPGKNQDKRAVT
jgi:DNA uptake protein ComE-like DNA-binding protein